jgi:uncharacterized membrane protein
MRTVLLIIHILAAGAWIGASVTSGFLSARFRSDNVVGAAFMRAFEAMGRLLFNVAGIVVLITGIWLVIVSDAWSFSDAFVSIGFLVVIVGALLGIFGFVRLARRGVAAHESANAVEIASVYARLRAFGTIDLVLLVVAVSAMVGKWGT